MVKRAHPEDALQRTVVQWLAIQARMGRLTYFAIPNNPRNAIHGARLKKAGMSAGVPDLCIIGPQFVGFIELKAKDGRTSPEQASWELRLAAFQIPYALCRSLEEVQGVLNAWMVGMRRAA